MNFVKNLRRNKVAALLICLVAQAFRPLYWGLIQTRQRGTGLYDERSMSLVAKIDADLKAAMIAKDAEKLSVLRMLKSAVKYAAIEKGGADSVPTDLEVIAVVRKEVKKREDSISSFSAGGRTEMADKEKKEMEFLKTLLPAQLTPEKLEAIVKEAIAEVGATSKQQMGSVMKAAQARAAGQADGKTLSQLVQRLLP